jgi:hypothetical protein
VIAPYTPRTVGPGPVSVVRSHLSSGPLMGATIYTTDWHVDSRAYIDDRLIEAKSQGWNLIRPTDQWNSGDDPYLPAIWLNMDHLVSMAAALGMYVQLDLSGYRRILQGQGKDAWDYANWPDFLDQTVAHYADAPNIAMISVIGEPAYPKVQADADKLLAFYRAAIAEVRRVDGGRHLVIPGGFTNMLNGVPQWWKPILDLGDLATIKLYSVHDNQYLPTVRAYAESRNIPLVNDEFGMPQSQGDAVWSGQTYNSLTLSRADYFKQVMGYGLEVNIVWNLGPAASNGYDVNPDTPAAWSALSAR